MSQFYDLASLVVIPSGYKASTIYAQKPLTTDGQLSFSRASTATRVNSSGLIEAVSSNVPRLDYTNSSCPRLLLEPQRTNLATFSEQFNNAAWTKDGATVTANATTAPDGTTSADKILETATTAVHNVYQVPTLSSSIYSVSFFVKKAERFKVAVADRNTGGYVAFNLNTGTIIESLLFSGVIQSFANDWYRLTITSASAVSVLNPQVFILPDSYTTGVPALITYAGSATSGIFVWGAQLEAGSYATSYIPTLGASVTRVADAASKTGISSLIGQTEGVLFVEVKTIANNEFKRISLNNGAFTNSIFLDWDNGNNIYLKVINGGGTTLTILGAFNYAITNKVAIAYKNNDYAFYINGTLQGTSTSVGVPSGLSAFQFSLAGNQLMEGTINQALLFKTRLTNAQLAELTTL